MPRDYARVLAVLDKAKAEGLDEEATANRVMESVSG
jgi:glutamate synthase (NADPH/NADH) large chain